MDENAKEQHKQLIREVVQESIDNIDKAVGKFIRRMLGAIVIVAVLYISAKLGVLDKLIGF